MSETTSIPTWHETIDFDVLMREARKHLTALAGDLWTDHNPSDPGITMMEVLAFCIADLSYRTSFDVKDIVTGYKGGKSLDIDLPLADVALTNHPVTIKDLRKVLIDMVHPRYLLSLQDPTTPEFPARLLLRNAFPIIWEEHKPPFFCLGYPGQEHFLTFNPDQLPALFVREGQNEDDIPVIKDPTPNLDPILLNGLYGIQVEFEEQPDQTEHHLKDLNQNYFEDTVNVNGKDHTLSVLLPYWDDIKWSLRGVILPTASIAYKKRGYQDQFDYFIAVDKLNYDDYFYDFYAELLLDGHQLNAFIKVKTPLTSSITVSGKTYEFSINFLDWNEVSNGVERQYGNLNPVGQPHGFQWVNNVSIDDSKYEYDLKSEFTYTKIGTNNTRKVFLLTRFTFKEGTVVPLGDEQDILNELKNNYKDYFDLQVELERQVYLKIQDAQARMYQDYLTKLNLVFEYLYETNGIWEYLGQFRNLCEEYAHFSASRVQEIALFGKVLVAPNYNVNELLAEIYFRIDRFLDPLVKFRSLSEMTTRGHTFESIFNGPLLTHGFIEDEDLDNLKRRSVVYTSDLIRIIMDVPGVLAVEDFNISSYIDNRLMGRNVINCLSLTNSKIYKPRFSAEKTGLDVCVDDQEAKFQAAAVISRYKQKLDDDKALQISDPDGVQLTVPLGDDMEVEAYRSIQHDFPEVYGIGEYGLPLDATEERKARAKQLKAFLLPFEQLFANYLKQVAHLPELFSYNRHIDATYAFQPLYEVPDVQPLFTGFVNGTDTWEDFKADLNNAYHTLLDHAEDPATFRDRRSRFLSQMLSRFGESFTEYATQMFDRHKALLNDPINGITLYQAAQADTLDKLISDKISFAEDYPKVSGQRYHSFDMTRMTPDFGQSTWNNENIGSYKLRLCRLLGITNINNGPIFAAQTDINSGLIDIEGMHIVEHILLRPRTDFARLMELQNRPQQNGGSMIYQADKDPYSFTITIVLPKNAGRFKEPAFRDFTERLIRLETPAHIRIHFSWLSGECGKRFEYAYGEWKKNLHKLKPYLFQNLNNFRELDYRALMINVFPEISVSDPRPIEGPKIITKLPDRALPLVEEPIREAPIEVQPIEEQSIERDVAYPEEPQFLSIEEPIEEKPRLITLEAPVDPLDPIPVSETKVPITKSVIAERPRRIPTVMDLQDRLIEAMETPCTLRLKLYDNKHVLFTPFGNQILFEDKKKDVFNIRVSETGGNLTVYKRDPLSSKWVSRVVYNSVPNTYFHVSVMNERAVNGLTTTLGGVGEYKFVYELGDYEPVVQLVTVTPAIVPVHIWIGNKETMLNFDTEKDGVFSISNKTWKGHFLQFDPQGGTAMISNNRGLAPAPLPINRSNSQVQFDEIYKAFGIGTFLITYELDGQTTFATIELTAQLSISIIHQGVILAPNAQNLIQVEGDMRKFDIKVDLPGGTLKVYDLDGVVPILREFNPRELIREEETQLDDGAIRWYKKVDTVTIDRDTDTAFKDGHRYELVYEFLGQTVRETIILKKLEVVGNLPTLQILRFDEVLDKRPLEIRLDNDEATYFVRFNPAPGKARMWIDVTNPQRVLDSLDITQDHQTEPLNMRNLYQNFGEGPFYIAYKTETAEVTHQFRLKREQIQVEPAISLFQGEKDQGANALLDPAQEGYAFHLNTPGGRFVLYSPEEGEYMEIKTVAPDQLILPIGVEDLLAISQENPWRATYENSNGVAEIAFSIKQAIKSPPEPTLDAVFQLEEIVEDANVFQVTAIPLYPSGRTYIWRQNGTYKSRAKNPRLTLDFNSEDRIEIELTMHLDGQEASHTLALTAELLRELMHAK